MNWEFIRDIHILDNNILLLIGVALFFGAIGGRFFQKMKVPQVVGYIILGIILGQSGFKLLSEQTLMNMEPFNFFALGLIGFSIGGELKFNILKKYGKQFTYILFFEALTAFVFVSVLIFAVVFWMTKEIAASVSLALLFGSISSATAAAGTTDVLWEYKAKGPLTSILLGIVALDDVVALFLFAISSSVVSSLMGSSVSLLANILTPLYEIGGAAVVGTVGGYILAKLVLHYNETERILAFSVGGILAILGLAGILGLDMIMACMIMGFVLVNYAGKKAEEVFSLINKFTPPIYVVFFVLVGAKLNVSRMSMLIVILFLLYLFGRTAGKMVGATLGAMLSKASSKIQKYLQFALFSQSGVAIGLSILASQKFPGTIGDNVLIVITASTFIVQIIGPSFTKFAIEKAGEMGLNVTEEDLITKSKVSDFVLPLVHTIRCEDNLKVILKIFSESDELFYPVIGKDKKIKGVISVDNIKDTLMYSEISDLLVAVDMMENCATEVHSDTPMKEVIDVIKKNQLEYVTVVDKKEKFAGLLEYRSIQRQLSRKLLEVNNKIQELG